MSNVIKIQKHFSKEEYLKKYTKLPFTLPENVDEISIRYFYDKGKTSRPGMTSSERNSIDLAVFATDGFYVGSSGWARDEIVISENYSTPGYKRIAVKPGEWNILLGFEKLKSEGCDVEVQIKYTEKVTRFYKGDLHVHTYHSDGKLSPAKVLKKARKNHLDFFFSTDHNTNTACSQFPQERGFCVIPGLELTCYAGHFNLLGTSDPVKDGFHFTNIEELNEKLDYAKKNGALLSMNHPTCKNCGWRLPFEGFPIDMAELWNGPMRIDNVTALEWWHKELLKGRRIVAVGGSDFHADYVVTNLFANPCTQVYAKGNTQEDIMDGLKKGHCFVTAHSDTSFLNLECGDAMMGDTLPWKEGTQVKLTATKLKRGYMLRVFNNDNLIYERKGKGEKKIEEMITVPEKGFVRAEIRYNMRPAFASLYRLFMYILMPPDAKLKFPPFVWAYGNPIFFE